MAKHRNPAYTEEFRKEAVRLAGSPDRTAASVAKELGISAQQIYNWKRQFNRLSDKHYPVSTSEHDRLKVAQCEKFSPSNEECISKQRALAPVCHGVLDEETQARKKSICTT